MRRIGNGKRRRVLGVRTGWPMVAAAWTDNLGVVMTAGLEKHWSAYEPLDLEAWSEPPRSWST